MFKHLTQKAQQALSIAESCAVSLKHDYIGPEHILYGLAKEGTGLAAIVLSEFGVTADDVLHQLQILTQPGNSNSKPQFTVRSSKVLELAYYEAQRTNQQLIGTEHILVGLVRGGNNIVINILDELGVDPAAFTKRVVEVSVTGQATRSKSGTPVLDKFGKDLTELARQGKIDPVIGREDELEQIIQVLIRRTKNNPCLVGEAGVGKTVIVEGLALMIAEDRVPEMLKNKRIFSLDIGSMVAGTKFRGDFEQRLKQCLNEAIKNKDVILFIDELHTIIGAGNAEGSLDAANMLKPALARGELRVIGATTIDEYRKYIEKDPAFERRFKKILVDEPSKEDTIAILKGIRDKYEQHHGLKISNSAIKAIVEYSCRYVTDRNLPDKAIDLMDEAFSRVRLAGFRTSPEVRAITKQLDSIYSEKTEALEKRDFAKATALTKKEKKLRKQLMKVAGNVVVSKTEVDEDDIAEVVTMWTKIPVKKLVKEETERLLNMEKLLHEKIIGQDEAVNAIAKAIRRSRAGISEPRRPISSFLFLGPTGVGKTALAKALAEIMFGTEDALIRIDMSEYSEKIDVSKLTGAAPGYVGYEEGGQLTNAVRKKPYSVILFDEVEKAHPEVFNTLLQVLDDGRLTDNQGRRIDFSNTIIIMTSNIGARDIISKKKVSLGFNIKEDTEETKYEEIKQKVLSAVNDFFRPEFINRIDEMIIFHPLTKENIYSIIDLMIADLNKRLSQKNISIAITDKVREFLMDKGYKREYGARPMRRAIREYIEDRLAEEILKGNITSENILIGLDDENRIVFLDPNSVQAVQSIPVDETNNEEATDVLAEAVSNN